MGNTDPIVIFFRLLSIHLPESKRPAWLAGVALGVAANIKLLPVRVAPAALLSLPGTRRTLEFSARAAAALLAGSLPFLVLAPPLVSTRVLGYSSQSDAWGLSLLALAAQERARFAWLHNAYAQYGMILSGPTPWKKRSKPRRARAAEPRDQRSSGRVLAGPLSGRIGICATWRGSDGVGTSGADSASLASR